MERLLLLRVLRLGAKRRKLSGEDLHRLRVMLVHIHEWRFSSKLRQDFESLARKYDCWEAEESERGS